MLGIHLRVQEPRTPPRWSPLIGVPLGTGETSRKMSHFKYYARFGAGMVLAAVAVEAAGLAIFAIPGRVEVAPVIPAIILVTCAVILGMYGIDMGGGTGRAATWAQALWPISVLGIAVGSFVVCSQIETWADSHRILTVAVALTTGIVAAAAAVTQFRGAETLVSQES